MLGKWVQARLIILSSVAFESHKSVGAIVRLILTDSCP